jgi:phosphatidylinositol alpha-1,6-mannosyltransferase
VLLVTPDFPPAKGGIQTLCHRIARHAERFDVRVRTLAAAGDSSFDRREGLDVRRTRYSGTAHPAAVARLNLHAVGDTLRFRPAAVISAHVVVSPGAWTISRTLGIPFVQYLHADELRRRPRLTGFAVRRAAACIAVSRHTRAGALALGAPPARIVQIPNGVDARSPPVGSGDPPTIMTVAQLAYRYKGHDVILRALPLVRARVPRVRWVVVGDGALRPELERRAADLGVEGNVEFTGEIGDEERDQRLAHAAVFVMPSRVPAGGLGGEGFGIAYLEASALGLPVVAGIGGGAPDAVVDGETGVLVDPLDHVELADALVDLLLDPDRSRRLGRAGAVRAESFLWSRIASRVETVLSEVTASP